MPTPLALTDPHHALEALVLAFLTRSLFCPPFRRVGLQRRHRRRRSHGHSRCARLRGACRPCFATARGRPIVHFQIGVVRRWPPVASRAAAQRQRTQRHNCCCRAPTDEPLIPDEPLFAIPEHNTRKPHSIASNAILTMAGCRSRLRVDLKRQRGPDFRVVSATTDPSFWRATIEKKPRQQHERRRARHHDRIRILRGSSQHASPLIRHLRKGNTLKNS